MNPNSAPTFSDNTDPPINHTRTFINPILWVVESDGYRVIFCRHENLYRVAVNDTVSLALIAVTLRQSRLATQIEIASAFGHSVATQRRWETRYTKYGLDGLQPRSPTGRPAKLDHGQQAFVQRWFQQGVSNLEMARRLGVSEATIRRVLRQAGLRRPIVPETQLPFHDTNPMLAETATTSAPAAGVTAVDEPAPVPAVLASVFTPPAPTRTPADNVPTSTFTIDRDPADRSGDRA